MRRVWTKAHEQMGDWYHFVCMVNSIFNTPPVQPGVCMVCRETRTKSSFSKQDVTKTGCQVFADISYKHKIQEKGIPSKIIPSENLVNRRLELTPLAALSQHLDSEGKGRSAFHVEMSLCHTGRGLGHSSFTLKVPP